MRFVDDGVPGGENDKECGDTGIDDDGVLNFSGWMFLYHRK